MVETFELTNYNSIPAAWIWNLSQTLWIRLKKFLKKTKTGAAFVPESCGRLYHEYCTQSCAGKEKTFLIGITGESASGKTVFVDNTIEAVVRDKKKGFILLSGRMIITKTRQKSCLKQEAMMLCLKQGSALILRM